MQNGDVDRSQEVLREFSRLQQTGITNVSATQADRGTLGALSFPRPRPLVESPDTPSVPPLRLAAPPAGPQALAGASEVRALDLVEDWPQEVEAIGDLAPTDLVGWSDHGLLVARHDGAEWNITTIAAGPIVAVEAFDLGRDGALELWVATPNGLDLLEPEGDGWRPSSVTRPKVPSPPRDIEVADFDHEGDLDLLLVGGFGARLWRNDGAAQGGAFMDVTTEAGVAIEGPLEWCVAEDLDTDQDVDFLVGGAAGVHVVHSLRGGRFAVAALDAAEGLPTGTPPLVEDLDGDGRPDLRFGGAGAPVLRGIAGGGWMLLPAGSVADPGDGVDPTPLLDSRGHPTGAVRIALRGAKDNRRGVGAIVELRADRSYRRLFWRGEPVLVDLGGREKLNWLRVTWPNGVVQTELEVPAGTTKVVVQKEGLVGSCPFLYTWNGRTFEYVTDVLGITPLGLPAAPGVMVPPDHDEYVRIRGDQLVAADGVLRLQITEELREVTYLDRVRLDVVDHPANVQVYPNERFKFPPFPRPHLHTVVDPLPPRSAIDDAGRDWREELFADDLSLAAPFRPYSAREADGPSWGGQFLGLAPPHSLELTFDPTRTRGARRLRLVMTGWFYWTEASVNVSSARTPGVEFAPPVLEVPDGEGGWREAPIELGFPAGKLKTIVVDVSDVLPRENPRLRLSSTLRLYWDSIRLAVDDDDAPHRVRSLEPLVARLWERGFSTPIERFGDLRLEWFEWERTEAWPRWNAHPGLYTRLGDVLPLLGAVDDRFVILGAGDALTLGFDATELSPPPEGWTRDYILFLDGWAKDRDPNTIEAEFVEPLPFHGMSGYPYGAGEAFPDTPEHRRWRLEWLTRPARRWIDPLAPNGS